MQYAILAINRIETLRGRANAVVVFDFATLRRSLLRTVDENCDERYSAMTLDEICAMEVEEAAKTFVKRVHRIVGPGGVVESGDFVVQVYPGLHFVIFKHSR